MDEVREGEDLLPDAVFPFKNYLRIRSREKGADGFPPSSVLDTRKRVRTAVRPYSVVKD